MSQILVSALNTLGLFPSNLPHNVKLVVEGDDIALSSGSTGFSTSWLGQTEPELIGGPTYTHQVVATVGATIQFMVDHHATRIAPAFDATKDLNVLIIMAGTNGPAETPEEKYRALRRLVALARGDGYTRVVVCTTIPRNDGDSVYWGTVLTTFNTYIRRYFNNDLHADYLIDFSSDSRLDDFTDCTNLSIYNANGFTLTNSGYGVMANEAALPISEAVALPGIRTPGPPAWMPPDTPLYGLVSLYNNQTNVTAPENLSNVYVTRSVLGHHEGKWAWGTNFDQVIHGVRVGIFNEDFDTYQPLGSTNSLGLGNDGTFLLNGASMTSLFQFFSGEQAHWAIDIPNGLLWINKQGFPHPDHPDILWNNNALANPETGVGGIDISAVINGKTVYVGAQVTLFQDSVQGQLIAQGDTPISLPNATLITFKGWNTQVDESQIVVLPPPPAPAPPPPAPPAVFALVPSQYSRFIDSYWLVEEAQAYNASNVAVGEPIFLQCSSALTFNGSIGTANNADAITNFEAITAAQFQAMSRFGYKVLLVSSDGVIRREAILNGSSAPTFIVSRAPGQKYMRLLCLQASHSTLVTFRDLHIPSMFALGLDGLGEDSGNTQLPLQAGWFDSILQPQFSGSPRLDWSAFGISDNGTGSLIFGSNIIAGSGAVATGGHYETPVVAPPPPPPPAVLVYDLAFPFMNSGETSAPIVLRVNNSNMGAVFVGTATPYIFQGAYGTFTPPVLDHDGQVFVYNDNNTGPGGNYSISTHNTGGMIDTGTVVSVTVVTPPAGPPGTMGLQANQARNVDGIVGVDYYLSITVPADQSDPIFSFGGLDDGVEFDIYINFGVSPIDVIGTGYYNTSHIVGQASNQVTEAAQTGTWLILVRLVHAGSFRVEVDYHVADIPATDAVELTNAVQVGPYDALADHGHLFKLAVPSGVYNLHLEAAFGLGGPIFMVRKDAAPSPSSNIYDYISDGTGPTPEVLDVGPAPAGEYYILLQAITSAYDQAYVTATYSFPVTNTTFTIDGPTTGFAGSPDTFTFGVDGSPPDTPLVCTLTGPGGTWIPNQVSISRATPNPTSQYTAVGAGSRTLTIAKAGSGISDATLSYSASAGGPSYTTLTNNVAVAVSGAANSDTYFQFVCPSYSSFAILEVTLTILVVDGDADIYVKMNGTPSPTSFDFQSNLSGNSTTNTEYASTFFPTVGASYNILVKGKSGSGYANGSLKADLLL